MPKRFIPSFRERPGYSSAESDIASDVDLDLDDNVKENGRRRKARGRDRNSVRYPRPHSHMFRNRFGGKPRGGKHARRQDNSLYLTALYQIDEEEYIEDYNNVVPEHNTPFKRLLTNDTDLNLWESFDLLSEDEQHVLISKRLFSKPTCTCKPEQLEQLDPHLRKILHQTKRLPKDFMQTMEEELREFFTEDKLGAMILIQLTSFQRMLVHGICQYDGLISHKLSICDETLLLITSEADKPFEPPPQFLHTVI